MKPLHMSTKEVFKAGLSFLFVVVVLQIIVGIIWFLGFGLFSFGVQEDALVLTILGIVVWVIAGVIAICGYIGLLMKILTDSIAIGVFKANNAGNDPPIIVDAPAQQQQQTVIQQQPVVQQPPEAPLGQ